MIIEHIKLILFGYQNGPQTFADALNLCSMRIAATRIIACAIAATYCLVQIFKED